MVTEDVIINFSPVSKQLKDGVKRPWFAEKQDTEIFWVANFVLSKKHLVKERFVLKRQ